MVKLRVAGMARFIGPGGVLDLPNVRMRLDPLEIVVGNTRAGSCYGREEYVGAGCGMGRDATLYLLERGVRVTGTDGWSWDAPRCTTWRRCPLTGSRSRASPFKIRGASAGWTRAVAIVE
jgi:kynurenine formamidase